VEQEEYQVMTYFMGDQDTTILQNVIVAKTIPVAPAPAWLPSDFRTPPTHYILSGVEAELPDGEHLVRRYVQARRDGDDWYLLC
jgi:hypothetical protein